MQQTLANPDANAAAEQIVSIEETLARIPLEGDENIVDRLGDAVHEVTGCAHRPPEAAQ